MEQNKSSFPIHIFIALAILVVALVWLNKELNNG